MKMEIVEVKVRPSYQDRKLHVLRFLFPDNNEYDSYRIIQKLRELFPYGFYSPKIERHVIDYSVVFGKDEIHSLCSHEYLSRYLNSDDDEGS